MFDPPVHIRQIAHVAAPARALIFLKDEVRRPRANVAEDNAIVKEPTGEVLLGAKGAVVPVVPLSLPSPAPTMRWLAVGGTFDAGAHGGSQIGLDLHLGGDVLGGV